MPYYFYDATYILVLIGALISMFASWNVQNTFRAYSRVWNSKKHRIAGYCTDDPSRCRNL